MIQPSTNSVIRFEKLNIWRFPIHEGTPTTHPFIDGISHYQRGYPVPHCRNQAILLRWNRRIPGRLEAEEWKDWDWPWGMIPCAKHGAGNWLKPVIPCDFRGVGQPPTSMIPRNFVETCWIILIINQQNPCFFWRIDHLERSPWFCNSWASSWVDHPVSSWLRSLFPVEFDVFSHWNLPCAIEKQGISIDFPACDVFLKPEGRCF